MNVYYWPEVEALKDYAQGKVVAVADSIEQAIELALTAQWGDWSQFRDVFEESYADNLRAELRATSPTVVSGSAAFLIRGSS